MKYFLNLIFFICIANTSLAQTKLDLIDSIQLPLGNYSNFKINPKGELFITHNNTNLIKIALNKGILQYPKKRIYHIMM